MRKICQTARLLRTLRWPLAQVCSISKWCRTKSDRVLMCLPPMRIAMNEAGICRKAVLSAPGVIAGAGVAFFVSREDAEARRG